ncbi:DUF4118 domain-containing protein [Terriglobus tenax]|uniref:DUF4118 domain-containing protein n=1 Tax=Terriglobus tenax TaxID=1111115 RepID=UPI0021E000A4|nr:DUF4118 domain-containing protein [Terriglobus tenax]
MHKLRLPNPYPLPFRYGLALAAAMVSIGLNALLVRHGIRMESAWMLSAVTVSAWFGGMGCGLLATLLCLLAQIFLRYPVGSMRVAGVSEWNGLAAFLTNALLISLLFRTYYRYRAWRRVSPVAITGGYWWRYDTSGESVELSSPEFPHITVTRTFPDWLRQVARNDRERVEDAVRAAVTTGHLDVQFHVVLPQGDIRLVEMRGVRPEGGEQGLMAVCLEMGASTPDPQAFLR